MYFGNEFKVIDLVGDKHLESNCAKTTIAHIIENFGANPQEFTLLINGLEVHQDIKEMVVELGIMDGKPHVH